MFLPSYKPCLFRVSCSIQQYNKAQCLAMKQWLKKLYSHLKSSTPTEWLALPLGVLPSYTIVHMPPTVAIRELQHYTHTVHNTFHTYTSEYRNGSDFCLPCFAWNSDFGRRRNIFVWREHFWGIVNLWDHLYVTLKTLLSHKMESCRSGCRQSWQNLLLTPKIQSQAVPEWLLYFRWCPVLQILPTHCQ